MNLLHTVNVNVSDRSGRSEEVLKIGRMSLPKKLLSLICGDFCEILVLTPGKPMRQIEITGMRGGRDG